jgi:hypothetical protein
MTAQLELLPDDASPLIGLKVKIERATACCANPDIATISRGAGTHYAELTCAACGVHRGWLSRKTASAIEAIIKRFGAPTEPIVFRR